MKKRPRSLIDAQLTMQTFTASIHGIYILMYGKKLRKDKHPNNNLSVLKLKIYVLLL